MTAYRDKRMIKHSFTPVVSLSARAEDLSKQEPSLSDLPETIRITYQYVFLAADEFKAPHLPPSQWGIRQGSQSKCQTQEKGKLRLTTHWRKRRISPDSAGGKSSLENEWIASPPRSRGGCRLFFAYRGVASQEIVNPPTSFCSSITSFNCSLFNNPRLIRINSNGIGAIRLGRRPLPRRKKGELQYQRSYNLIPTLRAKRCRRAIDRWQYSHLDVMTVSGSPRSRRLPIDQIHLICDSSLTVPLSAKSQSRSMEEWEENG